MEYEYQRYVTDIDNLKKTLELYGVAIIPNVLNDDECSKINSGIWDFFEYVTSKWNGDNVPINRNDQKTWKGIFDLYPLHSQLFKGLRSGQAQVSWDVRQNVKLVKIFAKLWECEINDLLVSFDSFSFYQLKSSSSFLLNQNSSTDASGKIYEILIKNNIYLLFQSLIVGLEIMQI